MGFIAVFAYRPNEYMPTDWKTNPDFRAVEPNMQEWPPFFHMPVLMLMLITLLNDGTLITIGYDIAIAPKTPPKWNMRFLFSMAFVQSFVAMISSLNLLWILLRSWEENSWMKQLGIGGEWFFMVRPAKILMLGACIALSSSTMIAMFWPLSYPDNIETEGLLRSPPYTLEVFVWTC